MIVDFIVLQECFLKKIWKYIDLNGKVKKGQIIMFHDCTFVFVQIGSGEALPMST